jgi:hypothetical protein
MQDPLASNIRSGFSGYRNREDVSVLNPNIMVVGSKNVLTNTYKRVGSRRGYTLDGQRSTPNSGYGIYGSFDWNSHSGFERNLRVGFNSTGSNGRVQVRYVAKGGEKYNSITFTEGQIYWIDIQDNVGSSFSACHFWDFENELKDLILWVDGTSKIYMWSGAISKVESTSWDTGCVSVINSAPTAGGTNYAVGDVLTITTGGTGCTVRVDAVAPFTGAVTSLTLLSPGSGYTVGAGKATSGGGGTGCTVEINTIAHGYIKIPDGATPGALGFLSSVLYSKALLINTHTYTYSKIAGQYFIGISSDPTVEEASSIICQKPHIAPNSSLNGVPLNFKNYLIKNLNNQIYLAASDNHSIYISNVNSFLDYIFSSPRKPGEGAILTLDGVPKSMQQQSDSMFISAGSDYWYYTKFQMSSDNLHEAINIVPIKTAAKQGCQSDALSTKIKNSIAFVSHEVQVNTLGLLPNFLGEPQVVDISYPIVHDVQNADFTDGHMLYFKKYLFITKPKEGIMLIYNMTQDVADGSVDPSQVHYWEAPQTLPIGRLSIINGELYGHAYNESNTYKLFDGFSDDGKPYKCVALFAYSTYGDRTASKSSNKFFVEGYKKQDTKLTGILRRGLNGSVVSWSWKTLPSRCLIPVIDDASIGKTPIGKTPIGGTSQEIDLATPPKFRLVQTYDRSPYFEEQIGFSSDGVGQWWELVSFSTNATLTTEGQSSIFDPNDGDLN